MPLIKSAQEIAKKKINEIGHTGYKVPAENRKKTFDEIANTLKKTNEISRTGYLVPVNNNDSEKKSEVTKEDMRKQNQELRSKRYDGDESEPRTLERTSPETEQEKKQRQDAEEKRKKYGGSITLSKEKGYEYEPPGTLLKNSPETEQEKKQREDAEEKEKKYGGSMSLSKERGYVYEAPGKDETKDGKPGRIGKDNIIATSDLLEGVAKGAGEVIAGAAKTTGKAITEAEKKAWEEKQNEMKGLKDKFYYKKVGEGKVEKVQK